MTRRTVIQVTDDLDGTPITAGDGGTVTFALDGHGYQIDLSGRHITDLKEALERYRAAARHVTAARRGQARPYVRSATAPDPRAVRAWATANGIELAKKGRVPATVVDQFRAAGH